ncbi:hypothetical protein BASA83_000587 [Batrachochytrium salamandrivorans]|nr:hypothetical protein BASA83_000587 [Batrachochytrium salamandrivorans]
MIAMLGTLLTEMHSHGTTRTWRSQISSGMIFRLGQGSRKSSVLLSEKSIRNKSLKPDSLTADIDWNDAALRSQFYHGLSSEIKDALVHFDNPSSVSAAMDMAIRIDNRLFERRQEQRLSYQRLHPVML